MMQHNSANFILKAALAWLILSFVTLFYGTWLIESLFPIIKAFTMMLNPDMSPGLKLVKSTNSQFDYMIELSAWTLKPIYLNADRYIPPGNELKSSIHVLHVLVPMVIEGGVLLVWPAQSLPERLLLIPLGWVTAVVVVIAIVPAHLLGMLETSFQGVAVTGESPRPVPWFKDWMTFCEMGGRWLLAIVAAWVSIQIQSRILKTIKAFHKAKKTT